MNTIKTQQTPIIIDIEASGFGRGSYPIEIGVTMHDGGAHCYLVQPCEDWTHWEPEAEKLHRLTRETIVRFGMDVGYVARQLNKFLEGQTVYSDAWSYDSSWLALLFERADILQRFKLEHLVKITTEAQTEIWEATRERVIEESGLKRHRASADARIIQATWLRTRADKQAASL